MKRRAWVVLILLGALAARGWAQAHSRVALLCITPSISGDLLEEAAVDRLQALRSSSGLSRTALPILQYSMDNPAERKFCEQRLRIREEQTPFIGVASYRMVSGAAGVERVLYRAENVNDYVASCTEVFARTVQERRRNPHVGIVVVSAHQHPPQVGADAMVQRIRNEERVLHTVAERAPALMVAAGFASRHLHVIQATAAEGADVRAALGLSDGDLPFVGLVTLSGGQPQGVAFRLEHIGDLGGDEAARQIVQQWGQQLAYLRQPHNYQVTLRGPNGQYVGVGGESKVQCKGAGPDASSVLTMIDLDGEELLSGQHVAFVTPQRNYVSSEDGGGKMLVANRRERGAYETFVIQKMGPDSSPEIRSGDHVVFRGDKGLYWTAENGGGGPVNNKGKSPSVWELFTVEFRR